MKILFDYHTITADPYSGKFTNMTRFADCLNKDPNFDVYVVYDTLKGADPPVAYQILRRHDLGYLLSSLYRTQRWWKLLQTAHGYDLIYTEVILPFAEWFTHYFQPKKGILHVDFQNKDLFALPKRLTKKMEEYSAFHVLSPVQREALVELGFPEDRVFMIPNCIDLSEFENVRPTFKERLNIEGLLVLNVSSSRDMPVDWKTLGWPSEFPEGSRIISLGKDLKRLPWNEYINLLKSADFALCLSPAGDGTTTRLFEFAAAGLPFVCVGSNPGMKLLLPSGVYFRILSKMKLENCLILNDSFRQENSKRLRREIKQFSYESTLPKLTKMMVVAENEK